MKKIDSDFTEKYGGAKPVAPLTPKESQKLLEHANKQMDRLSAWERTKKLLLFAKESKPNEGELMPQTTNKRPFSIELEAESIVISLDLTIKQVQDILLSGYDNEIIEVISEVCCHQEEVAENVKKFLNKED